MLCKQFKIVRLFHKMQQVLPIYEGNLSPIECHLFPTMKQNPGCHKFKENREAKIIVTQWLITLDTGNSKARPTI